MSYLAERRKYQRCDCVVCKALVSIDDTRWDSVDLFDLSAGGLSFYSNSTFKENERLHFNLYVYNMLSEFNIRLEGAVLRPFRNSGRTVYAVRFENMNKYQQVQLDELVKSRVTVRNPREEEVHTEDYSIFIFPRFSHRSGRIRI